VNGVAKSIASRASARLGALKRDGNRAADAASVMEAYELIAALAQELASLQAEADSQGYASPPAGTQTIVFADELPPSIKAVRSRSVKSPPLRLGIVQASKCE
jgi:hypothetical protein